MRRLKKFLFFLFVLALLTTVGIVYLNTVFFPLQARDLIVKKTKELIKRDVTIENIIFFPGKGIVLENIRIDQNIGDLAPLLTIKELSVAVPRPDIFSLWGGRLFIASVTIKNPVINLKYNESGQWNFSDLLSLQNNQVPNEKTAEKKPRFSIGAVNILEGKVIAADPQISETIDMINATAQIDLLRNINFELSFAIPQHSTAAHATGRFSLTDKELNADIKAKNANIPPLINLLKVPLWVDFKGCFLKKTQLALKFKDGEITLAGSVIADVDLATTQTATHVDIKSGITTDDFYFRRKGNRFTLKGGFLAADTTLTVDHKKIYKGLFKGNAVIMDRVGDQFDLSGNIFGENTKMTFNGQELSGHPQIENIAFHRQGKSYTLAGQAKISNAILHNSTLDLKATFGVAAFNLKREGTDFQLKVPSLTIDGINSLYANKSISGNMKGEKITVSLADQVLQTDGKFKTKNFRMVIAKRITLLGSPDIELTITRNPKLTAEAGTINYTGIMTLNRDTMQGVPKFDEINDLTGSLSFNNDLVETTDLDATIKGSPWKITGKVKDFKEPTINITASSASMNLEMMKDLFAKKMKTANADITGTVQNVVVTYEGLVFSKEPAEISASGFLKAAEITSENIPQKVSNINGQVNYSADDIAWKDLNFTYSNKNYISSGSLKNFETPDFDSTFSGDNFTLTTKGRFIDRIISLTSLKGEFHRAPFNMRGTISFRGKIPELDFEGQLVGGDAKFNSRMTIENSTMSDVDFEVMDLDLEKLKNCLPSLENKNIAGKLSLNAQLSGPLTDPGLWKGTGAFMVKEGRLLEIELLKGIWKTLFSGLLVEDYKYIAFTQANANFSVGKGRLSTDDLLLKSTSVDLSMKGWAGFNGEINFDVVANVRQTPLVTASAVKAVPTTIISQFAKNIVGFKLTGSLSQPQIKYKVLPLKVLKKTGDSVFLGIQGMMEDLLQ